MADVNDRAATARDRGQMLLVAAFGIAVMLVALALILNTSIYTENLATRGSDISGGKDAQRYRAVTEETFRGTVKYVNYNDNSSADAAGSYAELNTPARYAVWNYSNLSGRQQAKDSIVANVSLKRQSQGTRIYQWSGTDFNDKDGNRNWTVATDVDTDGPRGEGVRNFTISAPRADLTEEAPVDVAPSDPIFFVNFTESGTQNHYRVFLFEDDGGGDEVGLKVATPSGSDSCIRDPGPNDDLDVNITGRTLEGERCNALKLLDPVYDNDFDVRFNNTNNVSGQYSMVLNQSYTGVNVNNDDTNRPHKTRAVYSMNVHVTYESKRLYFETDIRIAPGEPDG